jgi:hypothetical protein
MRFEIVHFTMGTCTEISDPIEDIEDALREAKKRMKRSEEYSDNPRKKYTRALRQEGDIKRWVRGPYETAIRIA